MNEKERQSEIVKERDIQRDNTIYQELFAGTHGGTNRNWKKGKRKGEIE